VREAAAPLLAEQDRRDAAERETVELREVVSLERWNGLATEAKAALLKPHPSWGKAGFNKQENDSIEWAQWSWNPVTGCKHDCVYCYARDIALSRKMANAYPYGFEPAFRPRSLLAPRAMEVPGAAHDDVRFRNVFVCSMADLFGRWVPDEWINGVFDACRAAPDWNFLFLTKFPQRLAEFDLPANGWYGTTVDLQVRVPNAEKAFARIKEKVPGAVTWLSIEPMLDPLKFERLDLFEWLVVGGASRSSKSPEWRPPFDWIADLRRRAREAGCVFYMKDNLLGSRVLEAPRGMPVKQDAQEAPEVFRYLGKDARAA
jgi:protein gp37